VRSLDAGCMATPQTGGLASLREAVMLPASLPLRATMTVGRTLPRTHRP